MGTPRILPLLAVLTCGLPGAARAQAQLGPTELARAKSMLDLYRAQLSAEQYALLGSKLAQTEQAYVELTALTEAGAQAAAAEAGASAAAATGGRALLGSVVEALPVFLLFWPSTAHAPGMKEEKPEVRSARARLAKSVEELNAATRRVVEEQAAAASKRPVPGKVPTSPKGITCTLVRSGGGYNPQRPGKCVYECSNGRSICKLIRAPRTGCPAGTPALSPFPISDLDNLEDCP